jgi:hypothetical protein
MIRVALKLALAAAALWAVWSFVPVGGRTLAARWRAAGSFPVFASRLAAEVTDGDAAKPPARPQARQKPAPAPRPTEGHTESDRRAVERILSERLDASR